MFLRAYWTEIIANLFKNNFIVLFLFLQEVCGVCGPVVVTGSVWTHPPWRKAAAVDQAHAIRRILTQAIAALVTHLPQLQSTYVRHVEAALTPLKER